MLRSALVIAALALVVGHAAADCRNINDCYSCAAGSGWNGQCRWCEKAGGSSHCHDPLSPYNHCDGFGPGADQSKTNPEDCAAVPAPAPSPVAPLDTSAVDPVKLLQALFDKLGLDANAATCVHDVGGGATSLRDMAAAVAAKNASLAAVDLGAALSAFASSINDCDVPQLQAKLDALAARLHHANVTKGADDVVKVLVGASEIWEDLEGVAAAAAKKDASATASALAKLEGDWTTITGGCESGGAACKLVDGLLRMLGLTATDFSDACAADLSAALAGLKGGAKAFTAKNYSGAVQLVAGGLESLAQGLESDACNLKGVAAIAKSLAPKLEAAVVNATAGAVKIVVGSAEVYDELYQAAEALLKGDTVTFGEQIGKLLQQLRASNCKTKACDVLEGLLEALQLEAADYSKCAAQLDQAFGDFEDGVAGLQAHNWTGGVAQLGLGLEALASGVAGCGVPQLSQIVQQVATQMGDAAAAKAVGKATQVLVNGADIVLELGQAEADFAAKNFGAFGADLGHMAQQLNATGCKSWICIVANGLLSQFGIAFADLKQCEADFTLAEANFTDGATLWAKKSYGPAVQAFGAGLNVVAEGVADCGVAKELTSLANEANALGFAKVAAAAGDAATIVLHGADFYEELWAAVQALENHDYRGAGQAMGHVLNTLSQWTTGHACTADLCYVVEGVMEFMGELEGSIKECEADLTRMWGNFTLAYHDFSDEHSIVWEFRHDIPKVKQAVGELGQGFELMAAAVGDCHVEELSKMLSALAIKLGTAPVVEEVAEALKIIVEGVQIEQEVGAACEDYSQSNWFGFGYNIAKLLKTLL